EYGRSDPGRPFGALRGRLGSSGGRRLGADRRGSRIDRRFGTRLRRPRRAAGGGAGEGVISLRVYSRKGCPLCEEVEKVVQRAARDFPARIEVVDVDLDAELALYYGGEVPVLLVNGEKFAKYRIEEGRLRWKLAREALKDRAEPDEGGPE